MHRVILATAFGFVCATSAPAADVRILTAGAMKAVVLELVPQFEKETGHKAVVDIDPASGGSSGIYLASLFDKLGIAAEIKPKAKLKKGGYVAELIATGEAELGLHQISEILPVKGVKLVGPLPAEIQNYTTYAAAVGAQAREAEAAQAMLKLLAGPEAEPVLKARGMERPSS